MENPHVQNYQACQHSSDETQIFPLRFRETLCSRFYFSL
uniref:Uncharacterized protein n=1 Tax=Anguilla anguilla TaxID=7936 RepID=A0A0E9P6B5_ANGAN